MMSDYKYWIQNKAEEIALEEYSKDFYDLPDETQVEVYNKATEVYKNAYADLVDATYDMKG